MNKSMKSAQSGFTLIELIVVIVILGILAATALPKFTNLGGDARLASLQAAKGALSSTSAMAHGKYLVNTSGTPLPSVSIEGATITFVNGYPQADKGLTDAAGLSDYKIYTASTPASGNNAGVGATEVMLVPATLSDSPAGKTCYLTYKQAAANGVPTITVGNGTKTVTPSDCE